MTPWLWRVPYILHTIISPLSSIRYNHHTMHCQGVCKYHYDPWLSSMGYGSPTINIPLCSILLSLNTINIETLLWSHYYHGIAIWSILWWYSLCEEHYEYLPMMATMIIATMIDSTIMLSLCIKATMIGLLYWKVPVMVHLLCYWMYTIDYYEQSLCKWLLWWALLWKIATMKGAYT